MTIISRHATKTLLPASWVTHSTCDAEGASSLLNKTNFTAYLSCRLPMTTSMCVGCVDQLHSSFIVISFSIWFQALLLWKSADFGVWIYAPWKSAYSHSRYGRNSFKRDSRLICKHVLWSFTISGILGTGDLSAHNLRPESSSLHLAQERKEIGH